MRSTPGSTINKSLHMFRLAFVVVIVFAASIIEAQTSISINEQQTGEISTATPQVIYTFQGSAGQAVTVDIAAVDPLRVQFGLFDEGGVLLFAGMNPSQALQQTETITLPEDGTYIIQIISSNGQQGSFNLTLSASETPVAPETQSCETIMRQIVTVLDQYCSMTGRNQACYGNVLVEAQPSDRVMDLSSFRFSQEGDILDLLNLSGMELSPLDTATGQWGVALMQVQANLPESLPGTNVTMLVFGNMQVVDASTMNGLASAPFSPMQSIYIRPGLGATRCENTPDHGMLIQTPEGAGQIELTINDIQINVGSTVFVNPDLSSATLNFSTLEGSVDVTTQGTTQTATTGMKVSVPINEQLLPDGPPNEPIPFDPATLALLPLDGLLPSAPEPAEIGASRPLNSDECIATVTGNQRINVRQGPGTIYDVIGGLDVGEDVQVTGQSGSGWYEIDYNGYEAWLGSSVVELSGPCDDLPYAYIPPTPTPPATATPTATATPLVTITPMVTPTPTITTTPVPGTGRVAGDNEYPGVKVDYFSESPVYLSGAISDPTGDRQDTVNWALTNTQYAENADFYLSIGCVGTGSSHTVILIDGNRYNCGNGYNFVQPLVEVPMSGSFTITFDNQVDGAYVDWSAFLNIIENEPVR
ncbi:SH3 domain-containing protein [Phototrophicus methaneseepsis]|uniref:SH3 domain-containing protein n=1 Tax=Phototrophicus methaneseepsis TaxID=2710758 RepID=A0A7S8IGG6_9CHLR|nr:SH3 domain-containing protein [Phototrophicus methaneseepsis]QPC84672.1 SH3 domain-containing protein [Phototrophicus methaneseepsis]